MPKYTYGTTANQISCTQAAHNMRQELAHKFPGYHADIICAWPTTRVEHIEHDEASDTHYFEIDVEVPADVFDVLKAEAESVEAVPA